MIGTIAQMTGMPVHRSELPIYCYNCKVYYQRGYIIDTLKKEMKGKYICYCDECWEKLKNNLTNQKCQEKD